MLDSAFVLLYSFALGCLGGAVFYAHFSRDRNGWVAFAQIVGGGLIGFATAGLMWQWFGNTESGRIAILAWVVVISSGGIKTWQFAPMIRGIIKSVLSRMAGETRNGHDGAEGFTKPKPRDSDVFT